MAASLEERETTATSAACQALHSDLGWGLGTVLRGYKHASAAAMADVPGGSRGFQVLSAVAGDHPESQLALARRLGIDRTVMTYLLDDLERAGLVVRRAAPGDRRARRLEATGPGSVMLAELNARLRRVEDELLDELDPADREVFRNLLERLARRLDDGPPTDNPCGVVLDA